MEMGESVLVFNCFYMLLCFCIMYPPTEFVSLGWTIDSIFSRYLGFEEVDFVRYHQKRTSITLLVHASLPTIYFIIYYFQFSSDLKAIFEYNYKSIMWNLLHGMSSFVLCIIICKVYYWALNDWHNHPISKTLLKFANPEQESGYRCIVENILNECKRNVLKIKINSISSVIVTENWIMKTTPYFVHFAHQSDTFLSVVKSETFQVTADTDLLQMINIVIKPSRPGAGIEEFNIRINALDFRALQDRINRPIKIGSNIYFYCNLIDRFINAFKEQVLLNPTVYTHQISDNCFACMVADSNITIQKQCTDVSENDGPLSEDERCANCYCRPMWCVDCLARWFASRQNEFERDTWLQKKSTCPLCRAKFCMLDVCYIENIDS